ncbi:hypothetical protein GQ55_2G179400 [Panicum hallii var. hallii]|uniref:Uncharacterized protein n=1 Tax=Panicum hallii var. hallii TaxID=1504633 RepID=A0A2T7EQ90_9POAL|nr:hypothetical protein GQ55_2G179400 [Panicum hallii var. hallii]
MSAPGLNPMIYSGLYHLEVPRAIYRDGNGTEFRAVWSVAAVLSATAWLCLWLYQMLLVVLVPC